MLSYTRQKKGAGRKLTRPDCITGKERGNEGTLGEAAFLRKAPCPNEQLPKIPRLVGLSFHAMLCRLRLDVPPVRLRLASLPCAKIHRRTGAFFSAIARPHQESACCLHAMRRSARLSLARKSIAAQARSFRQMRGSSRKAHAAFRQYGAVRGLALRENPSPHRRVLFGNCSPPPRKRLQHSCDTVQCAACLARKSIAAQARSFRQMRGSSRKAHAALKQPPPIRLPNHAIST